MTVRIVTPGLLTTVQDRGRRGHQHSGIPVSGPMDPWAHRMANFLVGNDEDAAVLECTMLGPSLVFDRPTLVAITGGEATPHVGDVAMPTWRAVLVPANAEVKLGHLHGTGCRAYVAVDGGIAVPPVLGSRSTLLRAGLGGYEGRALRAGDELVAGEPAHLSAAIARELVASAAVPAVPRWGLAAELRPRYSDGAVVRVVSSAAPGSEVATGAGTQALFAQSFTIAPQSDRMGFRLQGGRLSSGHAPERLSEAVAFGTVQLPPDGLPIILMADRQTTGGYPRLGTIASVDMPLVGQLAPGNRIRFTPVSLDEAQRLYLAREQNLAQARLALRLRYHL
jgi:antagonist of KipI